VIRRRLGASIAAGALALAVAVAVSGCASAARGPIAAASAPAPVSRETLLDRTAAAIWRGDLDAAHDALGALADRRRGDLDPALDFWAEVIALLRCEPLGRIPGPARALGDPWDQLRRLAQIERARMLSASTSKAGSTSAPAPAGAHEIKWPAEREQWSDEVPRSRPRADVCPDRIAQDRSWVRRLPTRAEPEYPLVVEAAALLPAQHPASSLLLLDEAALRIGRGDAAGAARPVARAGAGGGLLAGPEQAELALAAALTADARARDPATAAVAITALRAALLNTPYELPRSVRRHLSLRLGERLRALGRVDDAAIALGPPPHGDDAVGRYLAFRQAEAHAKAGRRAELLGEARAALGKHGSKTVERDRALAAVFDMALRTLLASPVTAETLEVLEAIGVLGERLQRIERFAELAGAWGVPASSMATFLWLAENDRAGDRRLHHLARATVAAARAGDRAQFARTFALLAEGDDEGPSGLIESAAAVRARKDRRAARSANWQRAMLVVARDALPALVANQDQGGLQSLVTTLQHHLVNAGRGPVDEELTTVYRAASAHMEEGARSYAERIGDERRPILLGEIAVDRAYQVPVPESDVRAAEVGPLLFVPKTGSDPGDLRRWPAPLGFAWKGMAQP